MKRSTVLCAAIVILIVTIMPVLPLSAQATSTPTYTPTWSNTQRVQYATIPYASNCNPFTPCGALPWPVPRFPTVNLPTSSPYTVQPTTTAIPATVTPTASYTPSETPTGYVGPTPTVSGGIDIGPISTFADEFGELAATFSVQTTAVVEVSGTPVGVNEIAAGLGASVGAPFGFLKAIQEKIGSLGVLGTIVNFAFYAILFILFIYMVTALIPFALFVIRIILEVITAVKPF